MKHIVILFCLLSNLASGQNKYQKDFDELWADVNANYAYLHQQNIDWQKVRTIFKPGVDTVKTDDEFTAFLEKLLYELHNGHNSLKTNLHSSNRLVPSGADIFVEKINNRYFITDIRKDFGAEKSGIKIGMEIWKFNDREIGEQLKQFLPKYTNKYDGRMVQFAIDMLFAGTHNQPRKISILDNGILRNFYPDSVEVPENKLLVEYKQLNVNTGYIKVNNCLYDYNLISAFDKAVDSLITMKNIIIDLTETPSGGNTTVARALMGRFTNRKSPYQQHEIDELEYATKQSWVEYVIPRKKIFNGNVIVLVGHWTGSMGEGIAIGFDAMKNTTVIGTKMAGLLGAVNDFTLSETKIGFQIPTERLYHINGTPREDYKPKVSTKNIYATWREASRILKLKGPVAQIFD